MDGSADTVWTNWSGVLSRDVRVRAPSSEAFSGFALWASSVDNWRRLMPRIQFLEFIKASPSLVTCCRYLDVSSLQENLKSKDVMDFQSKSGTGGHFDQIVQTLNYVQITPNLPNNLSPIKYIRRPVGWRTVSASLLFIQSMIQTLVHTIIQLYTVYMQFEESEHVDITSHIFLMLAFNYNSLHNNYIRTQMDISSSSLHVPEVVGRCPRAISIQLLPLLLRSHTLHLPLVWHPVWSLHSWYVSNLWYWARHLNLIAHVPKLRGIDLLRMCFYIEKSLFLGGRKYNMWLEMGSAEGPVPPDFREAMLPEFPVIKVGPLSYRQDCSPLTPPPTFNPAVKPTVNPGSAPCPTPVCHPPALGSKQRPEARTPRRPPLLQLQLFSLGSSESRPHSE